MEEKSLEHHFGNLELRKFPKMMLQTFIRIEIKMFDPCFIGKVEAENVQLEAILPSLRHVQCFRAVVTLQGNRHRLLLKPNISGKRDQIVADRLKYLFGMKPMHVFGLLLNFLYRRGERQDCDWFEYFAISTANQSGYQTLDKIRLTPLAQELAFQVELCKVVMFRYVIGTSQTEDEHILVRESPQLEVLSISETVITSLCPSREFLRSLSFISVEAWRKAQVEIMQCFDYDYERGIILQTRQLERDIKRRRPKGQLTMKARDIATMIEDRLSLVTTCDVNEILNMMR
uniref:Uncharacterized protein n=1 Tax=viral metagenome TaxID=1070528 RepID=A0A6C0CI26_9ZZZZ